MLQVFGCAVAVIQARCDPLRILEILPTAKGQGVHDHGCAMRVVGRGINDHLRSCRQGCL